jgi:Aspartate/tyrosine/aromatic aminotransferase
MNIAGMISTNVKSVPPSGIRKYFDMINGMKDVISLGIGEPDFITPYNIVDAGISSLQKGKTHYSSNAGLIELREEIVKYLEEKIGVSYNAKTQVIVTVGASESIDLALQSLVVTGDEVIIPEPSFVAYKGCTAFTGATPVVINLREEDNFKLTPCQLENAITEKTKIVILPFPNNPTGAVLSKEEVAALAEVLKDKNVIVISDEIYSELIYKGKHTSIASFPGMKDKTLVINGFSKAFAMTGWRIGYVCGHPDLIAAMVKIHQYAIMCSPTTAQYAAIEALRRGGGAVDKMVQEYNARRKILVKGFNEMGLNCFEPFGAFYVFPCIKSTGLSSDEFCEKLLKEEKVLVVPGNAFGECGNGFIRATYANSMDNLVNALKRIRNFVDKIKQ